MTITTDQLGKRFNREWIFKNFSEEFKPGDRIALLGPNGSGKSTLLQILWGQMIPTAGTITWSTTDSKIDPSDISAHISIAAPYMDLIDEFSLEEHIHFHFGYKSPLNGMSVKKLISAMCLDGSEKKRIENFSSGMRQRLKVGLALFSKAEVTFLDEPTTNLDEQGMRWFQETVSMVPERTLLIATNDHRDYPPNSRIIRLESLK